MIKCKVCDVIISLVDEDTEDKVYNHNLWNHLSEEDVIGEAQRLGELIDLANYYIDSDDWLLASQFLDEITKLSLRIEKYAVSYVAESFK